MTQRNSAAISAAPEASAWWSHFDAAEFILALLCAAVVWYAPSVVTFSIPVIVAVFLAERLAPFRKQRVLRSGWNTDVYHSILTFPVGTVIATTTVISLVGVIRAVSGGHLALLTGQPLWVRIIEAVIVADFGAYCEHRMCHRIPFLWRFHRVHHMGDDLDWLSRYRIHPIDGSLLAIVFILPFYLLNLPLWVIVAFFTFDGALGTFSHSNVRVTFGKFWWLAKNPEYHRWHHAKDPAAYNRNFAEVFPIWDVLFGTSYLPRDREPAEYGVTGYQPVRYLDQLFSPFESGRKPPEPAG